MAHREQQATAYVIGLVVTDTTITARLKYWLVATTLAQSLASRNTSQLSSSETISSQNMQDSSKRAALVSSGFRRNGLRWNGFAHPETSNNPFVGLDHKSPSQ